ncbi:MAG: class I SAM-dependent methyltransferase [Bacteroidales bacterium]|nr:class I SAM-dependent methyltransferase [Bacteroidales bacterium]
MTREFIDFVLAHQDEDTARLLLSAARYPSIDMPLAVQQIEGRRTAREKWPSLPGCEGFLYPPRLNREQASSEATALHKASLYFRQTADSNGGTLRIADLTGGMGIDSFALAGWGAEEEMKVEVDYVERDQELCRLAQSNAQALGLTNIRFHCADSLEWLQRQERRFDLLFVDPARRDKQGRKVAAFEDCQPDIVAHRALLMSKSEKMMVKASPMIDITLGADQLHNVADIYIVAVHGECKEVLFLCGPGGGEPSIHCHNLHHGEWQDFVFTRREEAEAQPTYASGVGKYLYEPHAALMKAGPFKFLSQVEKVDKLAPNTHLYTSDSFLSHFPGRIFSVVGETTPSRKEVLKWLPDRRAHVVTRNFPMAAAELQKQLGLKEGGDIFVVATTLGREKRLLLCTQEQTVHFLHGK